MSQVFAVIGKESNRLFGVESKIFDDDKNEEFQEGFGLFGVGSVVNFIDIDLS